MYSCSHLSRNSAPFITPTRAHLDIYLQVWVCLSQLRKLCLNKNSSPLGAPLQNKTQHAPAHVSIHIHKRIRVEKGRNTKKGEVYRAGEWTGRSKHLADSSLFEGVAKRFSSAKAKSLQACHPLTNKAEMLLGSAWAEGSSRVMAVQIISTSAATVFSSQPSLQGPLLGGKQGRRVVLNNLQGFTQRVL